jgi:hypothetical protein
VFFAPRFAVSRPQAIYLAAKNIKSNPAVAKEAGLDFLALGGVAMAIMGLAKLAGGDVGWDPEDSDFGKIVLGNVRIDVFGGMLQPARLAAIMFAQIQGRMGLLKKEDPETGEMMTRATKVDITEALWRYLQYKMSPTVQIPLELARGKDVVGKPVGVGESFGRKLVPIIFQGAWDQAKQGKFKQMIWTVPAEFFGAGINVYEDESQSADIKRIYKAADYRPSGPRYPSWVKHKVKAEYDIIFGQKMAQGIRDYGITEKEDLQELASEIRAEMLDEIPEEEEK